MRALIARLVALIPGLALASDFFTLKSHGAPSSPSPPDVIASWDGRISLWPLDKAPETAARS